MRIRIANQQALKGQPGNFQRSAARLAGILVLACVPATVALADHHNHGNHGGAAKTESAADSKSDYSTATIKKVDAAKRRLLLSHGPIPNLGMSGMTMGFEVAAGVDLTNLNAGDNIQFKADQIKGQYTVTEVRKP